MSGFEITGVVLGAIPLIVSTLEHYGNGIETINNMRKYSTIFEDYSAQLGASLALYKNTCYQLLGPLNLPNSEMAALIDECQPGAWSRAGLQDALKARLGESHRPYVSLQKQLHKRILLTRRKLRLEKSVRPHWVNPDGTINEKARKTFFKNLRWKTCGGFNADRHGVLLAKIDDDIDKLSRLITGADVVESIKLCIKNGPQSVHWQNTRDQAQRYFDNLSSQFLPCACTHPHQASLRLELRRDRCAEGRTSKFAFLLTFERRAGTALSPPWDWRNIEIESARLHGSAVVVNTAQRPTPTNNNAPIALRADNSLYSHPPILRSPPANSTAANSPLCRALIATDQQTRYHAVLEDEDWQHHIYSVIPPATEAHKSETVSLSDYIRSRSKISYRQKCTLALTLASSVLQLYDTPWLFRNWGTKDIFILKNHRGKTIPSQFYVSRSFTSTSARVAAATKPHRLVGNEIVFALGIVLIEIALEASITSLKERDDLGEDGKDDDMTEVVILARLARELEKEDTSVNYAEAVRQCIKCAIGTFALDFDKPDFRETFYQTVVVPLQKDFTSLG